MLRLRGKINIFIFTFAAVGVQKIVTTLIKMEMEIDQPSTNDTKLEKTEKKTSKKNYELPW